MTTLSGHIERGLHRFPVRVYYEDTDAGGIVYHSQYLNYAERARTELLRCLGVQQSAIRLDHGIVFAVRDCRVEFKKPAKFDDLLEVRSRLVNLKGATLNASQEIWRDEDCLVTLDLRIAAVGENGRAARIPSELKELVKLQQD